MKRGAWHRSTYGKPKPAHIRERSHRPSSAIDGNRKMERSHLTAAHSKCSDNRDVMWRKRHRHKPSAGSVICAKPFWASRSWQWSFVDVTALYVPHMAILSGHQHGIRKRAVSRLSNAFTPDGRSRFSSVQVFCLYLFALLHQTCALCQKQSLCLRHPADLQIRIDETRRIIGNPDDLRSYVVMVRPADAALIASSYMWNVQS